MSYIKYNFIANKPFNSEQFIQTLVVCSSTFSNGHNISKLINLNSSTYKHTNHEPRTWDSSWYLV